MQVLLCENLFESARSRESMVKVLSVRLGVAAVRTVPAPFLTILTAPSLEPEDHGTSESSSATTIPRLGGGAGLHGLVVQIGHSECTVLPVCHGAALVAAAATARLGTAVLHAHLAALCRAGALATWHGPDGAPADPSGLTAELDEVLLRGCLLEAAAPALAARQTAGLAGIAVTLLAIIFNLVPIVDVPQPWVFALKVGGASIGINGIGAAIYWRGTRRSARAAETANPSNTLSQSSPPNP